MNLDELLAGVGGALTGGLRGYSWAKEMDQEDELQRERERARRDQNNARGVDMMLRERAFMNDETERTEKKAATESIQKIYDEWYASLPPEMQQIVSSKKIGGVTIDTDDLKTPSQRELEKKDAAAQKYLDGELAHTRALEVEAARGRNQKDTEATRHRYRIEEMIARGGQAGTSTQDDPALPVGVRGYLTSLLGKHKGDYTAAEAEWNTSFPEQQQKHPKLDPGKARTFLQQGFGYTRPTGRAEPSTLWGDSPASTAVPGLKDAEEAARMAPTRDSAVGARASRLPVELKDGTGRPTAQAIEVKEQPHAGTGLPVVTRSPEAGADQAARLEQQARGLITQFQAEKDPAKKAALRTQLARVRAELVKAQPKPGGQ